MRLVQFLREDGSRSVGAAEDGARTLTVLSGVETTHQLAGLAIAQTRPLADLAAERADGPAEDYDAVVAERRLLPPLDHPDPARCLVSGTGLTHLGSADARDRMHRLVAEGGDATLTDSMRVFQWGLEGGKPPAGQVGVRTDHDLVVADAAGTLGRCVSRLLG